jgi:glyoxylase-like metal-dependent hydrolase (beta-lactamase superfamily II)
MKLDIIRMTLGPMPNNVYLLGDHDSGRAVVIDPSFGGASVLVRAKAQGWNLGGIWLTHGHFDHIAGAGEIAQSTHPPLPVGLHPADLAWYTKDGGASQFGMSIPPLPEVTLAFEAGMRLGLDAGLPAVVEVRLAPGHSAGHVMFYVESLGALLCGDVIFRQGIGRTDLAGGDMGTLLESIRTQVFSLPDETRLLPGHGPETTVGFERENNPFL